MKLHLPGKNLFLLCLLVLTSISLFAQDNGSKPLDAFIAREKKQVSFKVKNNLWKTSSRTDLPTTSNYVRVAENLELNPDLLAQFVQQPDRAIRLVLPFQGTSFEIDLAAFDIFSDEFQAATVANGVLTPIQVASGRHYRGVVAGIPGSLAAFSFYEGQVWGLFSIPGMGNFNLVKNTLVQANEHNQYLLYSDLDLLLPQPGGCATDELPDLQKASTAARNTYNNCRDVEVYILADYATYLSASSNTTTVTNFVNALFNVSATIYRNEGVYISLRQLNINTTTDVYQTLTNDSEDFLYSFGDETQNQLFGADVAHLISTRFGTLGGIAWVGVLCASYNSFNSSGPYAFSNIYINDPIVPFPTYSWNVEVVSHEMGHNLGSVHTQSCSWPGGAIDACVPVEGSCATPTPQYPPAGGTIMSYCHLLPSVGINFSTGFGLLPGNAVRNHINGASCISMYAPDTVLAVGDSVMLANRECTNGAITTYWYDNNNSLKSDDRVALKILKGANDIGNLDSVGFEVMAATTAEYGNGSGTLVTFPANPSVNSNSVAMSRYWHVTPINQPSTNVEVRFPFTQTDIDDVAGNIPGVTNYSDLLFYKFDGTVDPDPSSGFAGATTANTHVLTYATTPSTTNWAYTAAGNTKYARFIVSSFSGGGGFGTTNTPLPVDLLMFSASPSGTSVALNWEIKTDEQVSEFTLAHAKDGKNYVDFGVLAAREDQQDNYYLLHEHPVQGDNFYRLSYTTVDGKHVVAGFAQVNIHGSKHISIYPNPSRGTLYIDLGGYGQA